MLLHALLRLLARVAVLCVLGSAGCGRFGYDLLPSPLDQGDGGLERDDAGNLTQRDGSAVPGDAANTGDGSACGECACGVAVTDSDGDGTPDCADECPQDANKSRAGVCGCGVSEQDTDLDGTPDCKDRCPGTSAPYTADGSCGVGYCHDNNKPSTCVMGVETACAAAAPLAASDTTCDGIDDDCDGKVDEDYPVKATACGLGVCASTGTRSCVGGKEVDSCAANTSLMSSDANCDGLDNDCNGIPDDAFPAQTHSCGMGYCLSMGTIECVAGAQVDSCTTRTPISSTDATCDNIDDNCNGRVDENYVVTTTSCGTGACARSGQKTCVNGSVVDSCKAATATTTKDTVCNNIDDDCDGLVDEDFVVTSTSCGVGYCAATGKLSCVNGATQNSCIAGAPRTSTDDAFTPGNGIDDNCNGKVDEDVPPCNTSTLTYEAGQYTIAVPGNCKSLTVSLWGGAGASGQAAGLASGGNGGAGGYASATSLTSGPIALFVGTGGASGCGNAGANAGSTAYNGGGGGTGTGANGADGTVAGGAGGVPVTGYAGGRGYFGGAGGGQGRGGLGASGSGGGGGAATVLLVNGTRVALAGGGGGGGGAQAISILGTLADSGGVGGGGCSGAGVIGGEDGGGGGGGGVCQGSTVTRGSGVTPANSGSIPSGRARGGSGSCVAGGNGYATITFAP